MRSGVDTRKVSENGKRYRRFFETKEQAQKLILETKRSGSIEFTELAVEEKHEESFPINFAVVDHGFPASRITGTANVNGELGDCP
jgi:hypothetical protein